MTKQQNEAILAKFEFDYWNLRRDFEEERTWDRHYNSKDMYSDDQVKLLLTGAQKENERIEPLIRTLLEINERLNQALQESRTHFNSIRSGLTTDINQVEFLTKNLAHAAHVEVDAALAFQRNKVEEIVG